jgi:hypothetical protein
MDPGLVTATVDLAVVTAGTADLAPAPAINPADHPVVAAAGVVRVPAGTAIPEAEAGTSQAQGQAGRAAATCAKTAISVTAAMVGRAVGIADSRTQKTALSGAPFFFSQRIPL